MDSRPLRARGCWRKQYKKYGIVIATLIASDRPRSLELQRHGCWTSLNILEVNCEAVALLAASPKKRYGLLTSIASQLMSLHLFPTNSGNLEKPLEKEGTSKI